MVLDSIQKKYCRENPFGSQGKKTIIYDNTQHRGKVHQKASLYWHHKRTKCEFALISMRNSKWVHAQHKQSDIKHPFSLCACIFCVIIETNKANILFLAFFIVTFLSFYANTENKVKRCISSYCCPLFTSFYEAGKRYCPVTDISWESKEAQSYNLVQIQNVANQLSEWDLLREPVSFTKKRVRAKFTVDVGKQEAEQCIQQTRGKNALNALINNTLYNTLPFLRPPASNLSCFFQLQWD